MKYYKFTVDTNDVHKAIGETGTHGIIVRTHSEGNVTHVYVASDKPPEHKTLKTTEVSEADVLKIG